MARIARIPTRFVYAAAVLGSLAFGATQAFAAPSALAASEARSCDEASCDYWCGGLGHCVRGACACY